jgi:hypothetical protein
VMPFLSVFRCFKSMIFKCFICIFFILHMFQ